MTTFQPRSDDYAERVHASFARQTVMTLIGASLSEVGPGGVAITLPYRANLCQQHGFLHAGIVTTIVDSACGYAALTLMPADAAVLSVEFKVNLLSPAVGEHFVARARVLKTGRTITVCTGDVFASNDGSEKHIATMTATMMTVQGRDGLQG